MRRTDPRKANDMTPFGIARAALLALLLAITATPAKAGTDPDALLAQLQATPGVTSAVRGTSNIAGTYFYRITFSQPVDHAAPGGARFDQRVTLLHRDEASPLVLVTDGYGSPTTAGQSELAFYLAANQLRVEHRFFGPSTPSPRDWSKLDIAQSSADLHAIRQAFKPLYPGGWVATGASKSGMTSLYYRYYWPNDVEATVPYVAPSSRGVSDARYVAFVNSVGPQDCRDRMRAFQVAALQQRDAITPLMPANDYSLFGRDRALEFAVLETPFAFWQYQNEAACASIPPSTATPAQMRDFLDQVIGFDFYGAPLLEYYSPYYYQSATQLGGPAYEEAAFASLLRFAGQDLPQNYPPIGVPKPFDASIMRAVERWVSLKGRQMVFIYGENDPWSTNAFQVVARNDAYRYFVRGTAGNHGARLATLTQAERDFILAKLHGWLGMAMPARQQSLKMARKVPPEATLMQEDRTLR